VFLRAVKRKGDDEGEMKGTLCQCIHAVCVALAGLLSFEKVMLGAIGVSCALASVSPNRAMMVSMYAA
jgi:hypothetical protein